MAVSFYDLFLSRGYQSLKKYLICGSDENVASELRDGIAIAVVAFQVR